MSEVKGKQSLRFAKTPFILNSASVVGKKEGEGPLGEYFDVIGNDDKFGCESWEEAESTLQKEAATLALGKSGLTPEEIRYIFAGDLLGQTIATSFGLLDFEIPLFGVYGACSTAGESMSLGAMCVAAGFAENVLTITSSHFCQRGETVSISVGIWESASHVGYLDGYRKWCLCIVHPTDSCKNQWNHHRKNCGLWNS